MKKLVYLMLIIGVLSFIISGCNNPVVPLVEQSNPGNLTKGAIINVPKDYTTIQEAIDAANDGDIIYVSGGTYNEEIVIDGKDLSLIAIGAVTIYNPSSSTKTIEILNSTCTINGFTVEGGLLGIYAREMVDVTLCNNLVTGYQKNGITINLAPAIGRIFNNTIIGGGTLGYPSYAQNGIQFGYGATGVIQGNAIEGNWYKGKDWKACGILVFEANGVTVQGNSVKTSETGIAVESWGWYYPTANENKIVHNTINNAEWGVSVAAYDWGYTEMDCSVNNNKVVNNKIEASSGDTGVFVGSSNDEATEYSAIAKNNKIINNQISGYTTDIENSGTNSKIHANVVE